MNNLHLLPTDKPSRLHTYKGVLNIAAGEFVASPIVKNDLINLNIYITNDETIKEGDWCINTGRLNETIIFPDEIIGKADYTANVLIGSSWKKIILTTDPKLIADGIQAINYEFLEWFVKNPSCEEVETIYGLFNPMGRQVDPMNLGQNHSQCIWKHKIIIPVEEPKQKCCQDVSGYYLGTICPKCNKPFRNVIQEPKLETLEEPKFYVGQSVLVCNDLKTIITKIEDEKYYFLDEIGNVMWDEKSSLEPIIEPKQETLEETAERNAMMKDWDFESSAGNGYYDYDYVEGFTEGAEWQAKQDKNKYSEEDMKLAFETGRNFQLTGEDNFSELINNLKIKV